MANTNKKPKQNFSESYLENEVTEFTRFIAIETSQAKLSSFLSKRMISSRENLWTVKKIRSVNSIVEVDCKKPAENLLKMKTFHNLSCKTYLYEKINISKGIFQK